MRCSEYFATYIHSNFAWSIRTHYDMVLAIDYKTFNYLSALTVELNGICFRNAHTICEDEQSNYIIGNLCPFLSENTLVCIFQVSVFRQFFLGLLFSKFILSYLLEAETDIVPKFAQY